MKNSLDEWVVPVIRGFVQLQYTFMRIREPLEICIISRVSCLRAGTRYVLAWLLSVRLLLGIELSVECCRSLFVVC